MASTLCDTSRRHPAVATIPHPSPEGNPHMNRTLLRRLTVSMGAAALLPFALGAAAAPESPETTVAAEDTGDTADSTADQEGSTAGATALEVGDVVVIGETSGQTSGGEGESSATAVEVLDQNVSGGEQSEPGTNEGELVGTGETPLGSGSVAPYEATVEEDGSTSSSASLAEATLVDEETAYVRVLGTDSQTSPSGASSHSDGAQVDLGDGALDAHVLHAASDAEGESDSAVALVNGNGVVTDEQADGVFCPLDLDPLLVADVVCATSAAGAAEADVVDGAIGDGALPLGAVTTDVTAAPDASGVSPDEAPTAAPATEDGSLPRTGLSVLALLGIGTASIGSGVALKRRR